uniref:Uncharacterized protein n=1 Tax=Gorilla gorilla gorilla TaxID=9595 RepID=A0A2I2YBV0_GORGO
VWPEPPLGPLSALLCLLSLSCLPECVTCQLPHHPPPSLPPLLPQGPPPISGSQAINLKTEMGLLSILWPLFLSLQFVPWFFSPFSASMHLKSCLFKC